MKNARVVMLVFLVLVLLVALVSCSVDAGSGTTDAGNTGGAPIHIPMRSPGRAMRTTIGTRRPAVTQTR